MVPIKLFPSEEQFFLAFQVPYISLKLMDNLHFIKEQSFEPVITCLLSRVHCKHVIACL
jgi:hypothetical protein